MKKICLCVVLLLLAGCQSKPKTPAAPAVVTVDAADVLVPALKAMQAATSYRTRTTWVCGSQTCTYEAEAICPRRSHTRSTNGDSAEEHFYIDGTYYAMSSGQWTSSPLESDTVPGCMSATDNPALSNVNAAVSRPVGDMAQLEQERGVSKLTRGEIVNVEGAACRMWAGTTPDPHTGTPMTVQYCIGDEDHLPRRYTQIAGTARTETVYSDWNSTDLVIVPPM